MKKIVYSCSFVVCGLFFIGCGGEAKREGDKKELQNINTVQINLPDYAGKDVFEANCLTCHSPAYIQMQPNFPRKIWEKTVDKMKKNFGAPIDSAVAVKIVDYLMAIKGKK